MIDCPRCGRVSGLREIIRDSDTATDDPWDRVMMECGCTVTVQRINADQIEQLAAGNTNVLIFTDPDTNRTRSLRRGGPTGK